MHVASGCGLQEVGVANGWNLSVWLVGVVVRAANSHGFTVTLTDLVLISRSHGLAAQTHGSTSTRRSTAL